MAVSTTNAVSGPYIANGSTTAFPFTFKCLTVEEVRVTTTVASVETEESSSSYSVTLNTGGNGGTVTFDVAPATGDVRIYSEPEFTQETGFASGQAFSPSVVNEALDRAAVRDQYILRKINALLDEFDAGIVGDIRSDLASTASGKGAALVGGMIADNVTINVPADYSTIAAAFAYVATKTITRGAVVTIKVADGTHTLSAGLLLNHPQGESIRLIGNQTTPANCIITVSGAPTFDALTVSNGHTLGLLDGFKFSLASKATSANNYTAILSLNGGNIICGSKIVTDNWYYGVAARVGSSIYCRSAVVSNAGDVGIWAFIGSSIDCQSAVVSSCSDSANTLGWGIEAEYGSSIDCTSATISGCYRGGIGSLSGSTIKAASAVSDGNTGMAGGAHGLFAENGGVIEAYSAQTINNSGFGIHLGTVGMGIVIGNSITNTGNTAGTYNTSAILDVTGGQSRLLFYGPSGARIDNANAAPIYVNTAGGAQFEFAHVASAVNHVAATGSATGSHVRLTATGTDANIDIALEAKGTGVPRFGGWTSNADAAVNGYVTIKDSSGNVRKLATIA